MAALPGSEAMGTAEIEQKNRCYKSKPRAVRRRPESRPISSQLPSASPPGPAAPAWKIPSPRPLPLPPRWLPATWPASPAPLPAPSIRSQLPLSYCYFTTTRRRSPLIDSPRLTERLSEEVAGIPRWSLGFLGQGVAQAEIELAAFGGGVEVQRLLLHIVT